MLVHIRSISRLAAARGGQPGKLAIAAAAALHIMPQAQAKRGFRGPLTRLWARRACLARSHGPPANGTITTMLDALRRGAKGWVAKLLFALLVAELRRLGRRRRVHRLRPRRARQGRQPRDHGRGIPARLPERDQRQISRRPDGASRPSRRTPPASTTASSPSSSARPAVEEHANELGLALSDEALVEAIKNDPAFQGPDGKFSRLAFESVLRQIGAQRARLPARCAARTSCASSSPRRCSAASPCPTPRSTLINA